MDTQKIYSVGIIGLGLIGGSVAKAIKRYFPNVTVFGGDSDEDVLKTALSDGAIDETITARDLKKLDYIVIALYKTAAIEYLKNAASNFKKDAVVFDVCGVKKEICELGFKTARENGFYFVGTHPMAGVQKSGYARSKYSLFRNAYLILCYDESNLPSEDKIDAIKAFASGIKIFRTIETTAERHDRIIAHTSQLPHVISNALVKSPAALEHRGFVGGSYQDMTRVAGMNEPMWTDLFLSNRENLSTEIGTLIRALNEYKTALDDNDKERLKFLIEEGVAAKDKF